MLISNLPIYLHINYDKNIRYFEYQSNNHVYVVRNDSFIKENNLSVLDLTSKNNKMFIGIHPRIYHNLVDNLAEILYLDEYFKSNPSWGNFEFILDSSDVPEYFYNDNGPTFFKFFLDVLDKKNINFRIINSAPKKMQELQKINNKCYPNKNLLIKVDNCGIIREIDFKLQNFNILSNVFKEYSENIIADKTVYLSRNSKNTNYANTKRQEEENIIENFFKNKGCEIVVPETFKNFKDQIKYFNSVKTIIGLTGSGLLNMLMMQDSCNVIEIYTPLETSSYNAKTQTRMQQVSTHPIYRDVAWAKNHTYLSIKNDYNSDTIELVKKLNNNKLLGDILKNEY